VQIAFGAEAFLRLITLGTQSFEVLPEGFGDIHKG
jgi:hypothetical protein